MTDAEQVAAIIAIAQEEYADLGPDRGVDIPENAVVEQEQGGCWVQARVWMANVYIEPEPEEDCQIDPDDWTVAGQHA